MMQWSKDVQQKDASILLLLSVDDVRMCILDCIGILPSHFPEYAIILPNFINKINIISFFEGKHNNKILRYLQDNPEIRLQASHHEKVKNPYLSQYLHGHEAMA